MNLKCNAEFIFFNPVDIVETRHFYLGYPM
jgi:hypothetical protein